MQCTAWPLRTAVRSLLDEDESPLPYCILMINQSSLLQKRFFATTVPGLEHILSDEIRKLSDVSKIVIQKSGVEFMGTTKTGLEALMWLRTSLRVMECLVEGKGLKTKDDLFSLCISVDWSEHLSLEGTLKCDAVLGRDNPTALSHTHFNSLTIKNAIVDQFRNQYGSRPNVNIDDPDLSLLLYLHKGKASLYKVWSGDNSMHKRGYRDIVHKAALRETTAAAILLAANKDFSAVLESDPDFVLMDPMCGSGTLAIEAALMMTDTAPGLLKFGSSKSMQIQSLSTKRESNFASSLSSSAPSKWSRGSTQQSQASFTSNRNFGTYPSSVNNHKRSVPLPVNRWPKPRVDLGSIVNSDGSNIAQSIEELWDEIYSAAQLRDKRNDYCSSQQRKLIYVNDIHRGAVELALQGSEAAQVKNLIEFCCADIANLDLRHSSTKPILPSMIVTNPPWDRRLEGENVVTAWKELNDFADRNIQDSGGEMWTVSGNPLLVDFIHLPVQKRLQFSAAGVDVELTCHRINSIER